MSEDRRIPIELTQGYVAYVDPIDADLAFLKYHAHRFNKTTIYACRSVGPDGEQIKLYLHREILSRVLGRELLSGEIVAPIDGDALNCERSNLKLMTPAEKSLNAKLNANSTSGYKGVSWRKDRFKWAAAIGKDNKKIHLGDFDTPEAAHEAYCKAAAKLRGEFVRSE